VGATNQPGERHQGDIGIPLSREREIIVALRTINVLSACSGVGAFDLGIKLAVPGARTVCYIEREAYAASVIVARVEDKALDSAPIWDDIKTFDGRPWRGIVDLVIAGIPCQPFSNAGERRGVDDRRWLWPSLFRIVKEVKSGMLFMENVPQLISINKGNAFGSILNDLAQVGYDAQWCCMSAGEFGAPHRRERLFLLATSRGFGSSQAGSGIFGGISTLHREGVHGKRGPCGYRESRRGGRLLSSGVGEESSHSGGEGLPASEQSQGKKPGEVSVEEWRSIAECSWWSGEPGVRRMDDGASFRVDRVRAIGNAVLPIQAALAFRVLAHRAGIG